MIPRRFGRSSTRHWPITRRAFNRSDVGGVLDPAQDVLPSRRRTHIPLSIAPLRTRHSPLSRRLLGDHPPLFRRFPRDHSADFDAPSRRLPRDHPADFRPFLDRRSSSPAPHTRRITRAMFAVSPREHSTYHPASFQPLIDASLAAHTPRLQPLSTDVGGVLDPAPEALSSRRRTPRSASPDHAINATSLRFRCAGSPLSRRRCRDHPADVRRLWDAHSTFLSHALGASPEQRSPLSPAITRRIIRSRFGRSSTYVTSIIVTTLPCRRAYVRSSLARVKRPYIKPRRRVERERRSIRAEARLARVRAPVGPRD